MAANNTGDDITIGQTNAGQDGTELRADANDEGGALRTWLDLQLASPSRD